MKKITTIIILSSICLFASINFSFAAYHEANLEDSELDQESLNNIEYQEYEFPEREDTGKLKELISKINQETENLKKDANFDSRKINFWVISIFSLIIIAILIKLYKNLNQIDQEQK
ncbi:hypothetical protein K8R66_05030, partial [bacterium]|nr:hypothetical protein [bacterium]